MEKLLLLLHFYHSSKFKLLLTVDFIQQHWHWDGLAISCYKVHWFPLWIKHSSLRHLCVISEGNGFIVWYCQYTTLLIFGPELEKNKNKWPCFYAFIQQHVLSTRLSKLASGMMDIAPKFELARGTVTSLNNLPVLVFMRTPMRSLVDR